MDVSWLGMSAICVCASPLHHATSCGIVLQDFRREFPGTSDGARDLLRKLLAFNPHKRFTVQDALEHPFLASVRDEINVGKEKSEREPRCKAGLFDDSFEHDYPLETEMPKALLQKYMFE